MIASGPKSHLALHHTSSFSFIQLLSMVLNLNERHILAGGASAMKEQEPKPSLSMPSCFDPKGIMFPVPRMAHHPLLSPPPFPSPEAQDSALSSRQLSWIHTARAEAAPSPITTCDLSRLRFFPCLSLHPPDRLRGSILVVLEP